MKSALSACILYLLFLPSISTATNYYVSSSGSSSVCSNSQPCREIRQALTKVGAGDTILVANGQYKGFTVRSQSGTASQPITIKAQGDNVVVLATTDRPTLENRDNIFITFSNHFVLDGLTSFNSSRSGLRVDTSHNVVVRNCTFGDNFKWGIFTNHANNIVLEGNTTYGSEDEHGIYFSNSADNPTIRNNTIYDNSKNGIHMNGDLGAGGASGVVGDGVISGARVEGNIIFNNGLRGGGGINMDGVQNSVIANNILHNNHASGIIAYQIDAGQGPRGLTIAHNTIDMASDARYALQVSETIGSIVIRNNILSTRSTRRGGLAYGLLSDVPNVSSRNNIFVGNPIVAFNDWNIRKTLSQWQAESASNEVSSFESNNSALFVNSNSSNLFDRNYHLKSGSPAINKGVTVASVPFDIDRNSRSASGQPDIGADEVVGSTLPPGNPPQPGDGNAVIAAIMLLLGDDDTPQSD